MVTLQREPRHRLQASTPEECLMLKPMCAMMLGASLFAASFSSNAVIVTGGGGGSSSSSDSSSSGSSSSSDSSSSSGTLICNGSASTGVIWPPDHSMVPETIIGVTDDPSLPAPAITIVSIQQDEPVLVDGSGNTQPDGSGVGTSTAYVRAERAG